MTERPGWTKVKFGDVVGLNSDRSADPVGDGLKRYVGLEHIQPGDLRVRSWGDVVDGTTFTNRFRPGHVLFGKRRAYQRKVAVAAFEGVCSGDIYVFETKDPAAFLPELLPFICQTDAFFQHAVGTSAGSLSPRTNWKSLSAFQFLRPPPDEQARIAGRLSAIETATERLLDAAEESRSCLEAECQWWATAGSRPVDEHGVVVAAELPQGWRLLTTRKLCTGAGAGLTLGPFGSSLTVKDYGHLDDGTPVLFVADVRRFALSHVSQKFISPDKHAELSSHEALPGDVLVTEMGWPPGEACVVPDGWPPSIIKADLIRARINRDLVLPEYLTLVLNSHWGQQQLVRISPGTTRPRMTLRDFERVKIAVPPIEFQEQAVTRTSALLAAVTEATQRAAACRDVKRSYLASIWSAR